MNDTYEFYKEELRNIYTEIKDCLEVKVFDRLNDFELAWLNLIFKGTDSKTRDKDKDSLEYKLVKWCQWAHNFNKLLLAIKKNRYVKTFNSFLRELLTTTDRFLSAKTREEELKVFDNIYTIDYQYGLYKTIRCVWLTEDLLETDSNLLPLYAPADLTDYIRDRDLFNFYKEQFWYIEDINMNTIIKESKELWRLYRLAVDKSLIIDNYQGRFFKI